MSKNNTLISVMKYAQKQVENITPEIYASIAIALHRTQNFGYEEINNIFLESQRIWEDYKNNKETMIQMCENETGIKVEKL